MNLKSKLSNFSFNEGRFVKFKIDVAHDQLNYNNSWFDAKVLEECAKKSLLCSPILANVYKDDDGEYKVGAHDMDFDFISTPDGMDIEIVFIEKPVGFIPHDAPIEMIYNTDDQRYHLHTFGVIWKNYSNQLLKYIENNDNELPVSMEIEVLDSVIGTEGATIIKDFVFNGITILGKDVAPAMKNAKIVKTFSMDDVKSELKEMIQVYAQEQKGGEIMGEEQEVKVVEEVTQVEEEVEEEVVEVVETETAVEEPICEPQEEVEEEFAVEEKEEVVEEVEEVKDEEYACDEKTRYEELEEQFNALQIAYSELQARIELMSDYEDLKAFKNAYDQAAYEQEVEEVSAMFPLDIEEYSELKEQVLNKEISVEQYKEKLGYKFAIKELSSKKFSKETKVSSEISVCNREVKVNAPYGGVFEKYRNKK